MITAVSLSLAITVEPAERNVMLNRPRPRNEPLLSGSLVWRILFVTTLLLVGTFSLFVWMRESGADIETARTAVVNAVVLFEVLYLFNVRRQDESAFASAFTTSALPAWGAATFVIVLQVLFNYAEPMWVLFHSRPLAPQDWAASVCVGGSIFLLVEIEKWLLRYKQTSA